MPTLIAPANSFSAAIDGFSENGHPRSPSTPPYSPITPTMSASLPADNTISVSDSDNRYTHAPPVPLPSTQVHSQQHTETQPLPIQHPIPSQPISESDNPDAIALRAAMSVLQIQRQQALRDLKTLERQKKAAAEDPEGFARGVKEGEIKVRSTEGILGTFERDGEEDEDEDNDDENSENREASKDRDDGVRAEDLTDKPQFGDIPAAQNVVRMPPINWAKYHIVGESLDKLHAEQVARPSPGQPLRDEDLRPKERAPEHHVAAPYNPWVDQIGEKPTRARGGVNK